MTDKKLFRILIADDNQASRKGLSALLNAFNRVQRHEMQIEIIGEAENGQEAVSLAHKLNPDLIFMDVKMPQMDGFEATEMIKKANMDTRIVVLSMHSDVREAAFQNGADEFIPKGCDAGTIKEVVVRFFNQDIQEQRS